MRICKVKDCNKEYKAKGYCSSHYMKLYNKGLLKAEQSCENHGMRNTLIYQTWFAMKARCSDKNHIGYHRYGGRGITVCDRWKNSFTAFLEDMGERPFPKAQIDRIDNNKGYYKENCRWVTNTQNCRNQRRTVLNMFTAKSIKRLYGLHIFTNEQLAKIYRLPKGTVTNVIYGRSWKEA